MIRCNAITHTHTHTSAKRQHQAVKLPIKCLPEKSLEVNEVVLVGGSAVTANEPNHPPSSRSSTSHQRSTLSKCKLAISSVVGVVAVADTVWGAHWQRFDNTTCGLVRVFHTTDELKSLAVLSQCFPKPPPRRDPKGIESYKENPSSKTKRSKRTKHYNVHKIRN